ncbi:bifunctional Ankyrin repeat/Ankyrin repeat-containing domain superfamily/Lysine methyltransferase/S-adenosyl-L-methionine-dependent methyltransferase superfamily [Babesia duncani]|uniref:Bifunctional Ankyrin repeat/Ankyrin repeat-containing domain superfamily/Lysine methyltransferase/S-adenosyl-L-methionine-dependent methyltransferase superfamily n=1 Tax=Babesia duncani TaxID=323732 RepID=A0AAD9UMY7_9APIC|nr:bifunctional Ankyrin repeat/Ankyrin repeat-containing domain superfamily/Lysine methyltransferase/S-adenosyl-L-methionine-dependent methyltransferase superfamily [Babesia duncani]
MSSDTDEYNDEWLYLLRVNDIGAAIKLLKNRLVTDLEAKDENGNTALHYCCANNLEIATFFLLQQCKFNYAIYNKSGNSPLHWAIQTNSASTAKLLLIHDYKVHEQEYKMLGACEYYDQAEYPKLPQEFILDNDVLEFYKIDDYSANYSKNNKIDLLRNNVFGKSALNDAFNCKDVNILQFILEHPCASILDKDESASKAASTTNTNVIHKFVFGNSGNPIVKMRELAIEEGNDILNATDAEFDLSGRVIWETALVASQWFSILATEGKFKDANVLELGCGCGLTGITLYIYSVYSNCQPMNLVLSDVNSETLDNLKYNLELNGLKGDKVTTLRLDWNNPDTWPQNIDGYEKYQMIIGSDLVYDSCMVQPLCNVIDNLLDTNGEFFYCFKMNRAGAQELPEELKKANFTIEIEPIPIEFLENPLVEKELSKVYFPDLNSDDFMLLHAKRAMYTIEPRV